MNNLTPTQAETIKLFQNYRSEKELQELKNVLSDFLAKKVSYLADSEFSNRGFTVNDIEAWKTEHLRRKDSYCA